MTHQCIGEQECGPVGGPARIRFLLLAEKNRLDVGKDSRVPGILKRAGKNDVGLLRFDEFRQGLRQAFGRTRDQQPKWLRGCRDRLYR